MKTGDDLMMRAWMYPTVLGVTRGVGKLSVDGIAGKVRSKSAAIVFLKDGLTFQADIPWPLSDRAE